MKYCTYCGSEMVDEAVMCVKCGRMAETHAPNAWQTQQPVEICISPNYFRLITKIMMILSTVVSGLWLIPLAWCIPMCVSYSRKIKTGERIGTGFKICTLLFVNIVAGIFMLCDNEQ